MNGLACPCLCVYVHNDIHDDVHARLYVSPLSSQENTKSLETPGKLSPSVVGLLILLVWLSDLLPSAGYIVSRVSRPL